MKVSGKHIVLTGGGNGIGRELVLQLLVAGARVTAVDRDGDALLETARRAGERRDRLHTRVAEVSDRNAVEALCADILAQHGPVDGLVNNAGIIQPFTAVADLDMAHIEHVMAVNFYGTVYFVKALLPHFLTRPEAHILNVSSMGGFLPVPGQTVYGASKAAVKLFTEGLHAELADTRVRVTLAMPGAVDTDISRNSGVAPPAAADGGPEAIPMLSVTAAASSLLDAMQRDRYRVLVGRDARTLDILYRLNPAAAARMVRRKMKGLLGPTQSRT